MSKIKSFIPYGIVAGIATKIMYSQPVTYVTAPGEKGVGLQLTPIAWGMFIILMITISLFIKNETKMFANEGRVVKKNEESSETPTWLKEYFEREEI
jgi:hypothetical protein